ncbi:MAG: hypothetical protein HRU25_01390 [Psychrobium sp.]|nr:hypothetical protein [Psychrobium sp.]
MKSVLIIGLGSLTKKIIFHLANQGKVEIIVLSRSVTNSSWLNLCGLFEDVDIKFVQGNALDKRQIQRLIKQYSPDLIINGASLASPFCLVGHPKAEMVKQAGFALQIGSQISIIMSVMEVVKDISPKTPVLNCSFPDLVNPILYKLNLAPTGGIGNVSMLEMIARKEIQSYFNTGKKQDIRVIGHHAHVLPILRNSVHELSHHPIVYCNNKKVDGIFNDLDLNLSPEEINHFTAMSAIPVINALLWHESDLQCSIPGVLGYAGGIPTILHNGEIISNLPNDMEHGDVICYFNEALTLDGVSAIEEDGTIQFTQGYKKLVSKLSLELTEPFHPNDALKRHEAFLDTFFNRNE